MLLITIWNKKDKELIIVLWIIKTYLCKANNKNSLYSLTLIFNWSLASLSKINDRIRYENNCMPINSPVLHTPLARATERRAVAVYVATIACTGTAGTWCVRSSTSRCLSTLASEHCVNKPIVNIKNNKYEYWNQTQTTIWRACNIHYI